MTYYVVAHFHYVLSMGAVFALYSAWYFWIPKILGLDYDQALAKVHFWIFFIGVNVTFFPQHFLGLQGMPRRISDYPDAFAGWNLVSSFGSMISVVAIVFFLHLTYLQLVNGKAVARYPWTTPQFYTDFLQVLLNRSYSSLEWALNSPPKPHAFATLPVQSSLDILPNGNKKGWFKKCKSWFTSLFSRLKTILNILYDKCILLYNWFSSENVRLTLFISFYAWVFIRLPISSSLNILHFSYIYIFLAGFISIGIYLLRCRMLNKVPTIEGALFAWLLSTIIYIALNYVLPFSLFIGAIFWDFIIQQLLIFEDVFKEFVRGIFEYIYIYIFEDSITLSMQIDNIEQTVLSDTTHLNMDNSSDSGNSGSEYNSDSDPHQRSEGDAGVSNEDHSSQAEYGDISSEGNYSEVSSEPSEDHDLYDDVPELTSHGRYSHTRVQVNPTPDAPSHERDPELVRQRNNVREAREEFMRNGQPERDWEIARINLRAYVGNTYNWWASSNDVTPATSEYSSSGERHYPAPLVSDPEQDSVSEASFGSDVSREALENINQTVVSGDDTTNNSSRKRERDLSSDEVEASSSKKMKK